MKSSNSKSKSKVNLRIATPVQKELYKDFGFFDSCKEEESEAAERRRRNALKTADISGKFYPKDPPPSGIFIPLNNKGKEPKNMIETASLTVGNQIRETTVGKNIDKPPGWLIEIPEKYFSHVRAIRKILDNVKDPIRPYDEIDALRTILAKEMKLGVEEDEICEVLKRIPLTTKGGYSFSHFMFAIANPVTAESKRVFLADPRKCKCAAEHFEDLFQDIMADLDMDDFEFAPEEKKSTKKKKKDEPLAKYGAFGPDYLQMMARKKKEPIDFTKKPKIKQVYPSGYSPREQILYSALFFIDMYPMMKKFKKIYSQDFIPPSEIAIKRRELRLGFAGDNIGIKKKGFAEWDRMTPKLPKHSPYLAGRGLVNSVWRLQIPNHEEMAQRRDKTSRKNVYLVVQPPKEEEPTGPIRMTENRDRIRRTLQLLATNGDCVARLPDIDTLISFGNLMVDKLEEITMNPTTAPKPGKIYHSQDMSWITSEATRLYRSFHVPKSLKGLDQVVPVTEGRKIRHKAEAAHADNWKQTTQKRAEYRKDLWKRLDPERIPCGRLRDSFIESFLTLMPHNTVLTTVHDNPSHI